MIMEITELMIGDIVQYLDGKKLITVVVVKVDGSGNVVRLKQKNGHKFNTTIDFLKPIPLTPEILESIGFEKYEQGGDCIVMWCGYGEDGKDDISIEFNVYSGQPTTKTKFDVVGSYFVSDNIEFIHQLQNAFALCKINKQISLP